MYVLYYSRLYCSPTENSLNISWCTHGTQAAIRFQRNSANYSNNPQIYLCLYQLPPMSPLHIFAPVMTGRRRAEFQFALATSPLEKSSEFKAGGIKTKNKRQVRLISQSAQLPLRAIAKYRCPWLVLLLRVQEVPFSNLGPEVYFD